MGDGRQSPKRFRLKGNDMLFKVKWDIDIEAETPEEAARKAYDLMKNAEEDAPYIDVIDARGKKTVFPREKTE